MDFVSGAIIRNSDNRINHTFSGSITGSPGVHTIDDGGTAYEGLIFAPATGHTQVLGDILNPTDTGGNADKAGIYLGGVTDGNVVKSINYAGDHRYGTVYKQGSGTWIVGNLTNGTVRLEAGTLVVNGTLSAGYNGLVFTGGTLAGTGVVNEATSVPVGAILKPGDPKGTLTVSDNCTIRGSLSISFGDAESGQVTVDNTLDISGATLDLSQSGTLSAPFYVLARYSALVGTFSTINDLPDGWRVSYSNDGANEIVLQPIPPTVFRFR